MRLRQSTTLLHVHVQEQTHIFSNVIYMYMYMYNTLLGYEIPMYMYHYVYGNTGMYSIYMYIHEPCVQQGRPGGVAIYNVYVGIQCKLRHVTVVRN